MEKKDLGIIFLVVIIVFLITSSFSNIWPGGTGRAIQDTDNLALNKNAYSNSCFRNCCLERCFYNPSLAVDGNRYTKWRSNKDSPGYVFKTQPRYWYVDLGDIYKISKIVIDWGYFSHDYELQYSNNLRSWVTLENKTEVSGGVTHDIPDIEARYWKVSVTYAQNVGMVNLFEFEVYPSTNNK